MTNQEKREITLRIEQLMQNSISDDYVGNIMQSVQNNETFVEAVIDDVIECSAWSDEGYYNDDDIRLAIGRVLISRLEIF